MSRTVEITVMSAEDLRIDRKPVKKATFATVKFDRGGGTEIDEQGGRCLVLDMPEDAMFLTIEVHCGSSSKNRIVGTVNVPVLDFLGRFKPENYLHLLSYRLRDGNGERNGIINISLRVKVPESESAITSQAIVGVPVAETARFGRNCGGGVVIGVPLWNAYSYKS
ncbi:BON1-associated protein 2-like [Momordica charantia]|uniref:BON1-associated protein 2-like n=1 Tax=Momordica charantia TaxID=3673 RepID=A0A6J1D2H0_MOMCH|nr:BON1-associated protein 2-like [Momordica charantia]